MANDTIIVDIEVIIAATICGSILPSFLIKFWAKSPTFPNYIAYTASGNYPLLSQKCDGSGFPEEFKMKFILY
jgi:hypothetical protein